MKVITLLLLVACAPALAQQTLTVDSAIVLALKRHPQLMAAQKQHEASKARSKAAFNLSDPQILFEAPTGEFYTPGIQQSFDNPWVYIGQARVGRIQTQMALTGVELAQLEVIRQVRTTYADLQFHEESLSLARARDSMYRFLQLAADRRYAAGDAGLLEKTSALSAAQTASMNLARTLEDAGYSLQQLALLTGLEAHAIAVTSIGYIDEFNAYEATLPSTPHADYAAQNESLAKQKLRLARAHIAPSIMVGYMNPAEHSSDIENRFQLGFTVPLWFWTHRSNVNAAKAEQQKANYESQMSQWNLQTYWSQALVAHSKALASVRYYENSGLKQSDIMLDAAGRTYEAGEIGYIEFMAVMDQVFELQMSYHKALHEFAIATINIHYLQGN